MAFNQTLKKICMSLGKNNNPAYAVMSIATVKGICRPIFTMTDKTEKPETKKYTALREGLTEVIAIPAYWGCASLAGKLAKTMKDAKGQELAKKNLMFLGVCTAALIIIPWLCSLAIKPMMKVFHVDVKPKSKNQSYDFQGNTVIYANKKRNILNPVRSFYSNSSISSGMKVGGV